MKTDAPASSRASSRPFSQTHTDRFGGVGRLFGRAALERLRAAHVCVVGVGGVGSWAVEALARSGVGALTLIDLDDVCVTNVNRQLPAIDGEIGRPKVEALARRARLINPEIHIEAIPEFFTAATADRLLGACDSRLRRSGGIPAAGRGESPAQARTPACELPAPGGRNAAAPPTQAPPRYDCVIDAIDSMTNKALLIAECARRNLRCVTVGGAGGKRDATKIRAGDLGESMSDDLLRLVRKKLRRDHGFARGEGHRYNIRCVYSTEKPVYPWSDGTCAPEPEPVPGGANLKLDCESGFGTAVFVTGAFGLAAAGEAVRMIVS